MPYFQRRGKSKRDRQLGIIVSLQVCNFYGGCKASTGKSFHFGDTREEFDVHCDSLNDNGRKVVLAPCFLSCNF